MLGDANSISFLLNLPKDLQQALSLPYTLIMHSVLNRIQKFEQHTGTKFTVVHEGMYYCHVIWSVTVNSIWIDNQIYWTL
jgi:hypothetical protein